MGTYAFLGAGVSAPLYPLWTQFLLSGIDAAARRGDVSDAHAAELREEVATDPLRAARRLRASMGAEGLVEHLASTFGRRFGEDKMPFTPLARTIVGLDLDGIVTTNYDPSVLDARTMLRRSGAFSGYISRSDRRALRLWAADQLAADHSLPILYLHGSHERVEDVVLDSESFDEAYHPGGTLSRFLRWLFGHNCVVFVGCSLTDPWIPHVLQAMALIDRHDGLGPRHCILLPDHDDPGSDHVRQRLAFLGVQAIRYPVIDGHHDVEPALLAVAKDLGIAVLDMEEEPPLDHRPGPGRPAPSPDDTGAPSPGPEPGDRQARHVYCHETTLDGRFYGRQAELSLLSHYVDDPAVRVVTVHGMGGLGKTALVTKLVETHPTLAGQNVIFWSCYANDDVDDLLRRMVDEFGTTAAAIEPSDLVATALDTMAAARVTLVIDGLEVLQSTGEGDKRGRLLNGRLLALVAAHLDATGSGRLIMTSRFPFTDITPHLGGRARNLDISLLDSEASDALARALAAERLDPEERQQIVARADGHPLTLRLAVASATTGGAQPVIEAMAASSSGGTLLTRLAQQYDEALPPLERSIIRALSLFTQPQSARTLRAVTTGTKGSSLPGTLPPSIARTLRGEDLDAWGTGLAHLQEAGLVTSMRSPHRGHPLYACHSAIRDAFRLLVTTTDPASVQSTVRLLLERPASVSAPGDDLTAICDACMLVLETGDRDGALDILKKRLEHGKVFLHSSHAARGAELLHAFEARFPDRARGSLGARLLGDVGELRIGLARLWPHLQQQMDDQQRIDPISRYLDPPDWTGWYALELLKMRGNLGRAARLCKEVALPSFGDDALEDLMTIALTHLTLRPAEAVVASAGLSHTLARYSDQITSSIFANQTWWAIDLLAGLDLLRLQDHEPLLRDLHAACRATCAKNDWPDGLVRWSVVELFLDALMGDISSDEFTIPRFDEGRFATTAAAVAESGLLVEMPWIDAARAARSLVTGRDDGLPEALDRAIRSTCSRESHLWEARLRQLRQHTLTGHADYPVELAVEDERFLEHLRSEEADPM